MTLLGPLSFQALLHPWFLTLLVGVAALLAAESAARAPGVMNVSTGEGMANVPGGGGRWLRRIPPILRALGLAFLVIALARPLQGLQPRKDRANVIDIMLCVDVSGSMRAVDFASEGQRRSRIDVTKDAVRDFIKNRKLKSSDRIGLDRIGLVLYGGYAWTQCPLTLDYPVLDRELNLARVDEQNRRRSGSTAIGSAIGLAVSKLRKSETKEKVIVLLTDGLNNAGELDPQTAAQFAKDYGIRIYTIGAGARGEVLVPTTTVFGTFLQPQNLPIDEDTLKKIASITGGQFYRATDLGSLQSAYEEINRLETTEIDIGDYYEHREGFVPWAVLGLGFVAMSTFSRRLWFETIP